jgi:2-hydroxychromene-2-carboxylate isomerase
VARGAFGAPTFFIGDEMYFGEDRLFLIHEALKIKCAYQHQWLDGSAD